MDLRATPAQIAKMLGDGPTCLVVLPNQVQTAYVTSATYHMELSPNDWQPLPLVSRFGIDLLYAKPESSKHTLFTIGEVNHPMFAVGGNANTTIAALTLECDPSSASFGTSARTAVGGVAFRYADQSRRLGEYVLRPIEAFVTERMTAIKNALAGPEGLSVAKAEYEKIGPLAFKMFFKSYRAEQARLDPRAGWKYIACPVTLHAPSCETCGRLDSTDGEGSPLMRCAKCRSVRYCSKECQAEDWKAHKPFCS